MTFFVFKYWRYKSFTNVYDLKPSVYSFWIKSRTAIVLIFLLYMLVPHPPSPLVLWPFTPNIKMVTGVKFIKSVVSFGER